MRARRTTIVLAGLSAGALLPLAIGCGGGGGGGSHGLADRVPVTTLTFPSTTPSSGSTDVVEAFPSLPSFAAPVALLSAPGDPTHLFVAEQRGRIRVLSSSASASSYATFLDITSRVTPSQGEMGLLSVAFHPGYKDNGTFFVAYDADGPSGLVAVLAKYQRSAGDPLVADPTETQLLAVDQPYANHSWGTLAFGPDGFLYAALGDGGAGGDPGHRAQNLASVNGKVLRIDVDHGSPYAIPADNPFATSAGTERKEVWAWGMRNAWRGAFDPTTGRLWVGDVGQDTREEIDVIQKGGNYGWRAMEGSDVYDSGDLGHGPFTAPLFDYGRGSGNAVVGGRVYRGAAIPSLYGAFVYGDYGSGSIWAMASDGTSVTSIAGLGSAYDPVAFGEDASAELYVCEHSTGRVKKLVPHAGGGGGAFPATLSATGIFADVRNLVPSPGIVPYGVNAPLWSDGALKDRLVALPGTERIGWSQDGAWTFPTGTVCVKTFRLPLTAGDASSVVAVETRVLVLSASGWDGYSYRWRVDGSDADLLPGVDTRAFTIADPAAPGGQREQTWAFPSRSDCLRCHTVAAGRILGLTTRQLNGTLGYGGGSENQLAAWDRVGMFDGALPPPAALPAHPNPSDEGAPVAPRARAYLDANCAMCHQPGGPSAATIDLRSTVDVASMNVVGLRPQHGDLGLFDPWIVQSGGPANSVLWLRHGLLDSSRMPPLASSVVDASGHDLLRRWILAGP